MFTNKVNHRLKGIVSIVVVALLILATVNFAMSENNKDLLIDYVIYDSTGFHGHVNTEGETHYWMCLTIFLSGGDTIKITTKVDEQGMWDIYISCDAVHVISELVEKPDAFNNKNHRTFDSLELNY